METNKDNLKNECMNTAADAPRTRHSQAQYKALLFSTLTMFANMVYASTVTCNNSQSSDRQAIQNAIGSAAAGDTLKILGTCQLDGTAIYVDKSNLFITGTGAKDNWSTVLKGIANANGTPRHTTLTDNNAFVFSNPNLDGSAVIKNVVIQNIKFSTLQTAVGIAPQVGGTTENCSDPNHLFAGPGSGSQIVIMNNSIDNTRFGFDIDGKLNNIVIRNNQISNSIFSDIFVFGQALRCTEIGVPTNISIIGNTITNDSSLVPIWVVGSNRVLIANNILSPNPGEFNIIQLDVLSNSRITNNTINANGALFSGIFASDWHGFAPGFPAPGFPVYSSNNFISGNKISNAPAGDAVDSNTTGYTIIGEQITNASVADIYLCGAFTDPTNNICDGSPDPVTGVTQASFNNMVVASPNTTVRDDGTNNKIIGGIVSH